MRSHIYVSCTRPAFSRKKLELSLCPKGRRLTKDASGASSHRYHMLLPILHRRSSTKHYPPATTERKLDGAEFRCYPSVNPTGIARWGDETCASSNIKERRKFMAAKHAEREITREAFIVNPLRLSLLEVLLTFTLRSRGC